MMMNVLQRLGIVVALSLCLLAIACSDTEGPKKLLQERGIPYTPESFLVPWWRARLISSISS
jgi:hypothetical protein